MTGRRIQAERWLAAALGACIVIGCLLRVLGARGELWLDELWSLKLIAEIRTPRDLLHSLAMDNNHYLNTLYLALIGPEAPPIALRLCSIIAGTVTIGVAGWVQRRGGEAATISAMLLFAISYPMVNVGSEARGYAGMILCALIAFALTERALEEGSSRLGLRLGLCNIVGVLFQPLMVGFVGALGLWVLWVSFQDRRDVRDSLRTARDLFIWTMRLLLCFAVVVGIALYDRGGYALGGVTAFDPAEMLGGIARFMRFLLGLPESVPAPAALAAAILLVGLALHFRGSSGDRRSSFYVILLLVVPAAMAAAHLPNTGMPRYYVLQGLAILLLLSDLVAAFVRRGAWPRCAAVVLLLLVLAGNMVGVLNLMQTGRGDVGDMIAIIAREGAGPITSNTARRDQPVIAYYLDRQGVTANFVAFENVCSRHPRWILTSDPAPDLPEVTVIGAPGCTLAFRRAASAAAWGLSGLPWTLYRAE